MNYLQALADLYRDGILSRGVALRPDLLEMVLKDRQSMAQTGHRLWIEEQGVPVETVRSLENGNRLIKYTATVVYAFEKEGMFYPDPSAKPFDDKKDAIDGGEFSFLVDAAGTVIGFADNLTGNAYGALASSSAYSKPWVWVLMGIVIFVALLLRALR